MFPPYVYTALARMGGTTVDDAYHLAIDDLNSSDMLDRVLSRKLHSFIQHHAIHGEFPKMIIPSVPYVQDPNRIPIKTKYAKDFPKFSGKIEDWIRWKTDAIAILGHNDWLRTANHKTLSTDPQFVNVNNSLYWALLLAVNFGEAQHRV